jgi:sulfide:quinone oxidoreductase
VFAVPGGVTWPLPIYELALMTATFADERGLAADVSIVTPESRPLEVFGSEISARVHEALADRMIRFVGDVVPQAMRRDGLLDVHFGDAVGADRVIALPELIGRRVSGVPAGWGGFVPVDREARVLGLRDVFAAGDMTTHPVKQGGLATQHADAAARAIAASLGIEVEPHDDDDVLEVRLAGAHPPLVLSAALDATGRSVSASVHRGSPIMPGEKVLGRYLSPYLHDRAPAVSAA